MLKAFLAETEGGLTPNTWWSYQFAGHNKEATLELKALFDGDAPFDTPKPVRLLRRILDLFTDKNSIVLDSFAGSGTTAHAVLQANHEDGGNRRFVLVQQKFDTKDDETENRNVAAIARDRVVRAIKKEKLLSAFTYSRVGEPLFTEYRDFGKKLTDWETLARYIFYTETGRECDSRKMDRERSFIGETDAAGGTSYYLRYTPDDQENERVSLLTLGELVKNDKNRSLVIYAERVWLHPDDLTKFEAEHGRKIRPMVVPFGLK